VDAQHSGVRYASNVREYRVNRFESADVYTLEERDVWEALAIFKSGTDPDHADSPGLPTRTPFQEEKIRSMARGFLAPNEAALLRPGLFTGAAPWEQRAAFLVKEGREPVAEDDPETRRLVPVIRRIWDRWHAMSGPNAPLERDLAGRRDFDYNLDGFCHYGMLPDFLTDLRNCGLTDDHLAPLMRSAWDYTLVWQRAEQRGG
jgi:hypothetical protein